MWIEDIELLASELPKSHVNLFFKQNKETFFKKIQILKERVPKLLNYEIATEILKIVASFRDAHTSAMVNISILLPFEVYWFKEGLYITSSIPKYKELEGLKITEVNGLDIDQVLKVLSSIISYENKAFLKAQLPKYFSAIELLYGLRLASNIENIALKLEDKNKRKSTKLVEAMTVKELNKLKGLKEEQESDDICSMPLYRRHADKYYWYEYIKGPGVVYLKYNSCKNMLEKDLYTFGKELISFIYDMKVEKLVIDLRNNFGGNSILFEDFIEDIKKCDKINKKGNLYIVTGRDTFSSALLNLYSFKTKTKAIFVGEITGGKPNCYGEVESFNLKNSGIKICYSTKYYKLVKSDAIMSFMPDILIEVSAVNFMNREDPCINWCLSH